MESKKLLNKQASEIAENKALPEASILEAWGVCKSFFKSGGLGTLAIS